MGCKGGGGEEGAVGVVESRWVLLGHVLGLGFGGWCGMQRNARTAISNYPVAAALVEDVGLGMGVRF